MAKHRKRSTKSAMNFEDNDIHVEDKLLGDEDYLGDVGTSDLDNQPIQVSEFGGISARLEQLQAARNSGNATDEELEALQNEVVMLQEQVSRAVVLGRCEMTSVGLNMPPDLSQDEWTHIGTELMRLEGSLNWMIGDWLAFGENAGYGEAKQIALELGKHSGTLWNWAWVARELPETSYRYEVLSHTHHVVVVSMTSPDKYHDWLAQAAEGDVINKETGERKMWSISRLKLEINKAKGVKTKKTTVFDTWNDNMARIELDIDKLKKHQRLQAIERLEGLLKKLKKN